MYNIVIQFATEKTLAPKASLLRKWAQKTLRKQIDSAEITIRVVDSEEMTILNSRYRHKNGPTNVLSFPFTMPKGAEIEVPILGDIVICADVVNREADEQRKEQDAHWAHMVVHGIFHLLGYDHENDSDANEMETNEIKIMTTLGFANPYDTGEDIQKYD